MDKGEGLVFIAFLQTSLKDDPIPCGSCMVSQYELLFCILQAASEMCAVSRVKRSLSETKKKWSQMKSSTKEKVVLLKREQRGTGGGPNAEGDPSFQESRVVAVVGDVCVRSISSGFDTCDGRLLQVSYCNTGC